MPRELGSPPILIRADSGPGIGTGHVMRCLALAGEAEAQGASVTFMTHTRIPAIRARIESEGFPIQSMGRTHPDPEDLAATLEAVRRLAAESGSRPWVVADGYPFDPPYIEALRDGGARVLLIDDNGMLPRYPADVVLNQNIHAPALLYACGPETLLLLGTRYALLRREFLAQRRDAREIPPMARRILVTLGGMDTGNVTRDILQALSRIDPPGPEVTVLLGPGNPRAADVEEEARRCRLDVRVTQDPPDLSACMAGADLALSAAGSTAWELALLGVPCVLVALAENQKALAAGMGDAGAAVDLGPYDAGRARDAVDALLALARDPARRSELSRRARALVDGEGPRRVVAVMAALDAPRLDNGSADLRRVEFEDAPALWRISNDPGVRRNSFRPDLIPWGHHVNWLRGKLSSTDCRLWVLEVGGAVAAQIRYERSAAGVAEVNFSVAAPFRGKGLGAQILRDTWEAACRELGVPRTRGLVFPENEASAGAFLKAGFCRAGPEERGGRSCLAFERSL